MDNFVEIARASDLPVGGIKAVVIGDRKIALYHTADGFFASDNVCPHRGGPLDEGDLIGSEIVCPWHLWGFDVITGICGGNPSVSMTTHRVKVEDGRVLVRLSPVRETSSTLL